MTVQELVNWLNKLVDEESISPKAEIVLKKEDNGYGESQEYILIYNHFSAQKNVLFTSDGKVFKSKGSSPEEKLVIDISD